MRASTGVHVKVAAQARRSAPLGYVFVCCVTVALTQTAVLRYPWMNQALSPELVLFPFGFGLSYTEFAYSDLRVSPGAATTVTLTVRNTSARAGAEVVQIYATLPRAAEEPFKRLIGFLKVPLEPGASKTVSVPVDAKCLSIFNMSRNSWELVPGRYAIEAGRSSRDLPLRAEVEM